MLSYFQLLCHWHFNLLDNTLEIQWMTQWKTHMFRFTLLFSGLFRFSVPLNPIVLAASNSILHFLTSIHNHEITQIVSGSFFASQGLPVKMPLILPVLHLPSTPSNTSEKDLREKKNLSSLWILVFRQLHWYPVTFKEMEIRNLFSFSKCFKKDRFCTECSFIMTGRPKSAIFKFLPNSWQQPSLSRWLFYKALVTKEKW